MMNVEEFHVETGMAGTIVDRLVQYSIRNGGIVRRQHALEEDRSLEETFTQAKRLTAGLLVANGVHSLNAHPLQAAYQTRKEMRLEAAEKEKRKERCILRKKIDSVRELRRVKPNMNTWNLKDCGTFIQYKKLDTDKAMPSKVVDRRQRCLEVMYRPSPCCSPHESDNEDEDAADENLPLEENTNNNIAPEEVFQSV